MKRTRILLADDHPQIRELLRVILEPEFKVVGAAEDGETLLQHAEILQLDVIISDINMPKVDGLQAAQSPRRYRPPHTVSDRPRRTFLRGRSFCSGGSRLSRQGRDDRFGRLIAVHDRQPSRSQGRTLCPTGAGENIIGARGRKTGPIGEIRRTKRLIGLVERESQWLRK